MNRADPGRAGWHNRWAIARSWVGVTPCSMAELIEYGSMRLIAEVGGQIERQPGWTRNRDAVVTDDRVRGAETGGSADPDSSEVEVKRVGAGQGDRCAARHPAQSDQHAGRRTRDEHAAMGETQLGATLFERPLVGRKSIHRLGGVDEVSGCDHPPNRVAGDTGCGELRRRDSTVLSNGQAQCACSEVGH